MLLSSIPDLYTEDQAGNLIESSTIPSTSQPPIRLCVACTCKDEELACCGRKHCRKTFYAKSLERGLSLYEPMVSPNTKFGFRTGFVQGKAANSRV
jgi:hypothetical protein